MSAKHPDNQIDPAVCWTLLERVAASDSLKRATRLREFLFYVSAKSLKEGRTELHEQEIGHDVFGRNESYDTSQDNIVRVSATELRKRINSFFEEEGLNEPILFEIPRGSYTPVFRRRAQVIEAEAPVVEAAAPKSLRIPFILASSLAILLAICCALLWKENQHLRKVPDKWEGKPALAALWQRFLESPRETDIILGDTSFALVEDIAKEPFSLSDYLNQSYMRQVQSLKLDAARKADLNMIGIRNNGSLGDFRAAHRIFLLDPYSPKLVMQDARDYTAELLKSNNVILIGSQKPNPWVNLFYSQLSFTIEYSPAADQSFIKNDKPQRGEQSLYPVIANPDAAIGYGIVAYLPNPSHTADALIIAGTNSQATDATAEFLTSEASVESFLKKLPGNRIPYFELLLKTTRLRGTPLNEEIIAYRTY